jgi:hypothetical protein
MAYKILNKFDEQGRLMNMPAFYEATSGGQYNSHGYSYLFARQQMVEAGVKMGLDKLMEKICEFDLLNGDW